MLDLSHIPNSQQDIQIFYANQGNIGYQTWKKPKKCSFVYIVSIDAGGGGSSGWSATLDSATATTCGGGSGGVTRALINSSFVPEVLYVKVGKGGTGGPGTFGGSSYFNPGAPGESSGVFCFGISSSQANASQQNSFIGGAFSAQGGAGGVSGVNGSSASGLGNNYLIGLTNWISLGGIDSANGNTVGGGTGNIEPLVSQIVTAGCYGAGLSIGPSPSYNGGGINASEISPLIKGGAGGGLIGGNGDDGYTSWNPFFSLGGAGGGNATISGGTAGNGGKGGIGSGGGAGGNANNGYGGFGGDGGDGVVMIISF